MSHIYTPTGSGAYVGAYTMPDDGDPRNASAFNVPMEGVAEDIKRVKGSLDFGEVDYAAVRHYEFLLPLDSAYWSRIYSTIFNPYRRYWSQTAHASVRYIEAPLSLPFGFEISSVNVWIDPGTGRANLPAVMPSIFLVRQSFSIGPILTSSLLGFQVDTSATLAAYEQLHNVQITLGAAHQVNNASGSYALLFANESGTNAQNGTNLYTVAVTGTVKRVY